MARIAKDTPPAYENPLMPNSKLRQIYLAMVQARMVGKAVPASKRIAAGLEACLVSTSVDLDAGDLVADALSGATVEFLRGAALNSLLRPAKAKARKGGAVADCGTPSRMPAVESSKERLWAAIGAAAALKAATAHAKSNETEDKPAARQGVVVVYLKVDEVSPAVWREALAFAAKQVLPMVYVVMPERGGRTVGVVSEISRKAGLPGIAVDGDDAVALYRVAQESLGRARMGGGAALTECVPFVVDGGKSIGTADAIGGLESYMLHRGVCTQQWMDGAAKTFARRIATAKQRPT